MKAGQSVYVKHDRQELKERQIEKVGRKYIYLKHDNGRKYDKDTLIEVTNIGIKSRIYLTKDDYDKEIFKERLAQKLARYYEWRSLSMEQLEEIHKIINK